MLNCMLYMLNIICALCVKYVRYGKYVKFESFKSKIKSSFMIYADFESIVVPGDNEKQNPSDSSINKFQKHIAFSYVYKLLLVVGFRVIWDKC